jgi:glucose-6-phosphate isomerase
MRIEPSALDGLPWDRAFQEMAALEAGALSNPDEQRQVGHYWLRAPERAPTIGQARAIAETAEAIRSFCEAVRSGREAAEDGLPFTDLIHIGIGGSALGPQLLVDALRPAAGQGLRVHFIDNTDPDGIHRVLEGVGDRLRHTLVLVVSKSGGTPEPRNGMLLVIDACRRVGLEVASRMVAITGEGSALHRQAQQEQWRRVFPLWDWVGGRTSVTSAVGLLPAELGGIDTQPFLSGARDMDEWTRTFDTRSTWRANPAALLAGCWHRVGSGHGDRAMVVLPYSDRLSLLTRYLQQLVMESLGKRLDRAGRLVEQGLTVYGNKGSTDQHAYVQQLRDGRNDFFAQFVQVLEDGAGLPLETAPGVTVGDTLQGLLLGTRRALGENGRPSLTITMPRVDAYTIGGLVALFERAVGLYASLIDVNAYHQPGVEAGKKAAAQVLALSVQLREHLGRPATSEELARRMGADHVEVWYVLERLVATGRATRDGDRYRTVTGSAP